MRTNLNTFRAASGLIRCVDLGPNTMACLKWRAPACAAVSHSELLSLTATARKWDTGTLHAIGVYL